MSARPAASLPPADREASVFSYRGVGVDIDGTPVLRDVTLDIPATGVTVVVGASGSGKSTLTRLCNRLLDPTDGIVCFRDHDVRTLDVLALRRAVGMVFQRATLFDGTVTDNLAVTGVVDRSAHDRVLAEVGLDLDHDQDASSLSGGEAQRLCLARTLLVDPQVLVADEPTASLDEAAARRLEELACDAAERGVPVLWVTHDQAQVDRIADFVVVLRDGTIVDTESRP